MNMTIVMQLIKKDWQMNQGPLTAYMVMGAIALWLFITENETAFMVGLIMLVSVVIVIGIHMVIATVVNERKDQTLAFIMSLPVSYREYSAAKVLSNWLIVGTAWLILYLIMTGLIIVFDNMPNGFIPYGTMTMLYLLCIYAVLLATALIGENEVLTIVVMTVANISISIFMTATGKSADIGPFIQGSEPVWNSTVMTIIGSQLGVILGSLLLIFYVQSKKRSYL